MRVVGESGRGERGARREKGTKGRREKKKGVEENEKMSWRQNIQHGETNEGDDRAMIEIGNILRVTNVLKIHPSSIGSYFNQFRVIVVGKRKEGQKDAKEREITKRAKRIPIKRKDYTIKYHHQQYPPFPAYSLLSLSLPLSPRSLFLSYQRGKKIKWSFALVPSACRFGASFPSSSCFFAGCGNASSCFCECVRFLFSSPLFSSHAELLPSLLFSVSSSHFMLTLLILPHPSHPVNTEASNAGPGAHENGEEGKEVKKATPGSEVASQSASSSIAGESSCTREKKERKKKRKEGTKRE